MGEAKRRREAGAYPPRDGGSSWARRKLAAAHEPAEGERILDDDEFDAFAKVCSRCDTRSRRRVSCEESAALKGASARFCREVGDRPHVHLVCGACGYVSAMLRETAVTSMLREELAAELRAR